MSDIYVFSLFIYGLKLNKTFYYVAGLFGILEMDVFIMIYYKMKKNINYNKNKNIHKEP